MSDNKPMSVAEACEHIFTAFDAGPINGYQQDCLNNLIAAVRSESEARVLAEFRELAEKILAVEIDGYYSCGKKDAADEFISLIQSLETHNQKP